jgi:hypothetical protein
LLALFLLPLALLVLTLLVLALLALLLLAALLVLLLALLALVARCHVVAPACVEGSAAISWGDRTHIPFGKARARRLSPDASEGAARDACRT